MIIIEGAEESNHQAAHGFITQHALAKDIKYGIPIITFYT